MARINRYKSTNITTINVYQFINKLNDWRETTMKTQEELNAIKEEVEAVNQKLQELTEDELAFVTGGSDYPFVVDDHEGIFNPHIYTNRDPDFSPKF